MVLKYKNISVGRQSEKINLFLQQHENNHLKQVVLLKNNHEDSLIGIQRITGCCRGK